MGNLERRTYTLYNRKWNNTRFTETNSIIGGTEVKENYKTVQDSQNKYHDVVHKLDVHFNPKKNLSYERYSIKICKQNRGEDCSVYTTRLKKMGETCEYENLNTEVKDQSIMSCTSTKMREKLLLEQDINLDICQIMESVKFQVKEMDDRN